MTPKSLLRHKSCVSDLSDFGPGTSFHRILIDPNSKIKDANVKRVILCSGKVYYDLEEMRNAEELDNVKILRIEQLYPFPQKKLAEILKKSPKADVVWCQEEPKNMGSWTFVRDYIEHAMEQAGLKETRPIYCGRDAAASPATGSAARHAKEQKQLVENSLFLTGTKKAAK